LAALFEDWKPDIVAANMVKAYLYMAAAARKVPRVFFVHGLYRPGHDIENIIIRLARITPPALFLANSRATLASYARLRYLGARAVDVVYPPCESPASSVFAAALRERPYSVSAGRLHPEKGFEVYIKAAVAVARNFPRARFLLLGGRDETVVDYEDEIRGIAAVSGLDGRLDFLGYHDDLAAVLAGATVFVNATVATEGFGRVILEAMQLGVPIIATDCGGPRELVVDGETGFLVPPGDATALAAKMELLLAKPSMAKQMGKVGRRRAEAEFAAPKSLAKLEGLIKDLVTER